MINSIDDLSVDQLSSLTGEQIQAIEENPENIDAILNADKGKQAEPSEKAVEKEASPSTDDKKTEKDPVLLNKSETGTIPYSTLQTSRKDNAILKEKNEQLEQQLADKKEASEKTAELAKAAEAAETPEEIKQAQADIDAHMAVLKEDFPDQYEIAVHADAKTDKVIKDQKSLDERLAKLEKTTPSGETEEQAQERMKIESLEAIDDNPDLANWRDKDTDAFDEAARQDDALRRDPVWAAKSFEDRYTEAVRKTYLVMPNASKPTKLTGGKLTDAEAKAKAKAKVDGVKPAEIETISSIKGAEGVTLSRQEELDNLDTLDMTAKIMQMSPEEAAAFRAEGE